MAGSTLEQENELPQPLIKGHGTRSLGPSDSSDTGSDIQGGPGLNHDDGLLSPTGTTSDPDIDQLPTTAGPDIGDADLDSDSDRFGTGERAAAGRDSTAPTDTLLHDERDEAIDGESIDAESIADSGEGDLSAAEEDATGEATAARRTIGKHDVRKSHRHKRDAPQR